jgi:hypothetical protein
MRRLALLLAACSLTACASTVSGPAATSPWSAIEIAEGACFGTCPIYSIRITPDDHFKLRGTRFTRQDGTREGALAPGAFQRITAILEAQNASAVPAAITPDNRTACGTAIMSDMPDFRLVMEAGASSQSILWYPGCAQSPYRDAMSTIREEVREAFEYETLVAPQR